MARRPTGSWDSGTRLVHTIAPPALYLLYATAWLPYLVALLGFGYRWLPELNLVPIGIIDPGKTTVGLIHPFGVNLYSL